MLQKAYIFILKILTLMMLVSCGSGINKQVLGPDEYFEYAKKKFDSGKYFSAITDFTVIVLKFSGNPIVDDAQYFLAESHFKDKEYLVAISEYQKLVNDYPQSPFNVLSQFKIGLSYYKLSLRPDLDQDYTKKSMRSFQAFLDENPKHEFRKKAEDLMQKLREKIAEKKMLAATTYRKMGVLGPAIIYYDIIISEYYDTEQVLDAIFWKAECQYKLKKYLDAQNTYGIFVEKYPNHKLVEKVKKKLSKINDLLKDSEMNTQAEFDGSSGK